MLVLDKPSLTTDPPELPPYLRKRGGGGGKRVAILPDLIRLEYKRNSHEITDHENNWKTTIYLWMNRVTYPEGGSFLGTSSHWEGAHILSRTYRQWLETYDCADRNGVPPHISFSGCITPGVGDPSFMSRWEAWAREFFF